MADDKMYARAMKDFGLGNHAWVSGTFKVMLLDETYVFDIDHEFVADVVASEVSGTGYAGGFGGSGRKSISGKASSITDGVAYFTGDNLLWTGLDVGNLGGLIIIKEVTTDADSLVIGHIISSFPQSTDGSDWPLIWNVLGIMSMENANA